MKRFFSLTTAMILTAGAAFASITASDLVTSYQAEGYTKIEVITGLTQIKVEAVQGTAKVEVIYDATTGAILSQHTRHASKKDTGAGVILTTQSRDFLGQGVGRNDDDADDDHGGSNGNGEHENENEHENEHAHDGGHDGGKKHGKSGSDD